MEFLTHLFYFLVCSALLTVAWCIFLFFNDRIDKLENAAVQGVLGTVNTTALLAALGVSVYFFALSFFTGVIVVMILTFLFYAGKRTLHDLMSAKG